MTRIDNFSKFLYFREKFEYFSFEGYSWRFSDDNLAIQYNFNISGEYFFTPKVNIPFKSGIYRNIDSLSPRVIDLLVFHTGMIELVSYWKVACPRKVFIKPGTMNDSQSDFWKKTYFQGLGEFFYLNSIHTGLDDFMEIIVNKGNPDPLDPGLSEGSLVPVGGGKDSVVSLELVKSSGIDWIPMAINPGQASINVIQASGRSINQTAEIQRKIDPLLMKLNQEGFLNGHTPFSAMLAFYSLLTAYLTGRKNIILSNESSASEATVPGTDINHQYSKSLEFEKDFREYITWYISPEFNYFSLLRPISELQIAKLFSGFEKYHNLFRSCNVGSKTGIWCGHCPKCLFTFIILSPFLEPQKLENIFGKNLLDDITLKETLDELSGVSDIKPFECIGTVEEVNIALDLSMKKYPEDQLPSLLKIHHKERKPLTAGAYHFDNLMKSLSNEHFVPEKYANILMRALNE